ncbi:uncharacterized protein LOC132307313 isoform X2 [Cornus florida]|uniref:uncharacterized protein LOC132307313 isoform X2 n=1 Tax=Cornus florida TaxID=4283 RepID=UPI00289B9CE9|nr:uncharacterized protein LOC132307313 isoform X2 [Cornus florida]
MERGMISVDQWSEGSQVYFLTHLHADHTKGLSSRWKRGPLFCSRITAKLFPFKFPDFKLSLLRVLEIGSWHSISLVSPTSGSETIVQVIAIDAHHCPGAVMFLFRGEFGCMLYTGDFRWETRSKRAHIARAMLGNAIGNDKVDIVYLDNTYCNPSYSFPSREVAAQQIWVWPERLQIMHLLGFRDIFTTKTSLTRVRAVPRYSFSIDTLEGLNTMRATIGIMPSGLLFTGKFLKGNDNLFGSSPPISRINGSKFNTNVGTCKDINKPDRNLRTVERYHEYIYSVPYSDHACFAEIQEFVKLVQPTNMKGIVSSSPSYVDPLYYLGHLSDAKQPSWIVNDKIGKESGERVEAVEMKFSVGSINSAKEERKRKKTQVDHLGVRVRRVSLLRRVRRGAKIAEIDHID